MSDAHHQPLPTEDIVRWRLRLPVSGILVAGFGGLVLVAVASVLILTLGSTGQSTVELLVDRAGLVVDGVEARIAQHLDPPRIIATDLAGAIANGERSFDALDELNTTLRGSLGAAPQVTGIAVVAADMRNARIRRIGGQLLTTAGAFDDPQAFAAMVAETATRTQLQWSDPLWTADLQTTLVALRQPIRSGDAYLGATLVGVSLSDLSRFTERLFLESGTTAAILFGDHHVLAHPAMASPGWSFTPRPGEPPLPTVAELGDPVFDALFSANASAPEALDARTTTQWVETTNEELIALSRTLTGYGPTPWRLVVIQPAEPYADRLEMLFELAFAGVLILVLAAGTAFIIGRRMARQIGRIADAADAVRRFEFKTAPVLPRSRVRELDKAARAFNAMVRTLAMMEVYVPKTLMRLLMRQSGVSRSQARTVTVMFTDIRGFTMLSDGMEPEDVAELLNRHFRLVTACIEAEGGTVDKFMGDAVMAFWNAPTDQPDHAARALRAARAIICAINEDNAGRSAIGLPPLRVGIGLHSGQVVAGDIGSDSRMNYTIVGAVVNMASRIESLAAECQQESDDPSDDVLVLASAVTVEAGHGAVGDHATGLSVPFRRVALRGVAEPVDIWRVLGDPSIPTVPAVAA